MWEVLLDEAELNILCAPLLIEAATARPGWRNNLPGTIWRLDLIDKLRSKKEKANE